LVENGFVELCGSKVLETEISDTPDGFKRDKLELLYTLCSTEVEMTEEIIERALQIQEQSNIRSKDSLHLACAEYADVDVLLTVDRKFRNNANRLPARIEVTSPTEWLVEVLYGKDN